MKPVLSYNFFSFNSVVSKFLRTCHLKEGKLFLLFPEQASIFSVDFCKKYMDCPFTANSQSCRACVTGNEHFGHELCLLKEELDV